ncbi:hypothetical protein MHC_00855 [Mycoplasma haemocanis str. Illinois]|uniref:Uncharacterized protein n=1 Tax=Mycoplasma haemocanis (strain Illinois) TaxID=1111676 RepID=H6N5S7_MYCHN|nr:hypothetical protein [Mycoplasma haemocanis]AEW45037.1 hypothetical protein MHC_00855 [Mycoplasma haemocanis str. Illinois]
MSSGAIGASYFKPWQRSISVKQELEKLGKIILTVKTDSRWEIKVHTYKSEISKDSKLKINEKDTISAEDLANWCIYCFAETTFTKLDP